MLSRARPRFIVKSKQFPTDFFEKENYNPSKPDLSTLELLNSLPREKRRPRTEKINKKILRRVQSNFESILCNKTETPKFNADPQDSVQQATGNSHLHLDLTRLLDTRSISQEPQTASNDHHVLRKEEKSCAIESSVTNRPIKYISNEKISNITAGDMSQNSILSARLPRPIVDDACKYRQRQPIRPTLLQDPSKGQVFSKIQVNNPQQSSESREMPSIHLKPIVQQGTPEIPVKIPKNRFTALLERKKYNPVKAQSAPDSTIQSAVNQNLFSAWKMIDDFNRQFKVLEKQELEAVRDSPLSERIVRSKIAKSNSNTDLNSYRVNSTNTNNQTIRVIRYSNSAAKLPSINAFAPNAGSQSKPRMIRYIKADNLQRKIPFLDQAVQQNSGDCSKLSEDRCLSQRDSNRVVPPQENVELNWTFRTPIKYNNATKSNFGGSKGLAGLSAQTSNKNDRERHEFSFSDELAEGSTKNFQVLKDTYSFNPLEMTLAK